jgi:hypothetical protein
MTLPERRTRPAEHERNYDRAPVASAGAVDPVSIAFAFLVQRLVPLRTPRAVPAPALDASLTRADQERAPLGLIYRKWYTILTKCNCALFAQTIKFMAKRGLLMADDGSGIHDERGAGCGFGLRDLHKLDEGEADKCWVFTAIAVPNEPSNLNGTRRDRMLDKGKNGGEPIPERLAGKPGRYHSASYAFLQSQDPLPPYELDPMFDSPVIRKRIGELIAKSMKHRL